MKASVKYILLLLMLALVLTMVPASLAAEKTQTVLSSLQVPESSPAYGNGLTAAQNLIVQTALSYFYKGDAVQYGSYALSAGKRNVAQIVQQTNNLSPDAASSQNVHYTVCSAFQHDVYYNALGYHVINHIDSPTWLSRLKQTLDKDYTEYTSEELDEVIALGSTTVYFAEYAYWLRENGYEDVVPYLYSNMTDPEGDTYHDPQYTDGTTSGMTNADVQAMIDGLQPGDILVAYNHDTDKGHAMMALGTTAYKGKTRQYIIHSSGYNYGTSQSQYVLVDGEMVSGYDRVEAPPNCYNRAIALNVAGTRREPGYDYVLENGGSIRVDVAQDLLGQNSSSYDINDDIPFFAVLRPLARENVQSLSVTHDGLARLQYPALEITKTASVDPYHSLRPGEEITFTIELTNRTDLGLHVKPATYTDLWIEEMIPAGTSCDSASNGVVSWKNVAVAPGETVSFSYTVTVEDSAERGQTITSPAGKVGGTACTDGWFETAPFSYTVAGERPEGISENMTVTGMYYGDTAAADAVYGSAGYIGIDLPQIQELIDAICTTKKIKNESTANKTKIVFKDFDALTGDAAVWANMIVPGYVGGTALHTMDAAGLRTNTNRLRQLSEDFLQVGDILIYADVQENTKTVSEGKVYVYLGNGSFGVYQDGEYAVLYAPIKTYVNGGIPYDPSLDRTTNYTYKYAYSEVLTKVFQKDFFVCLRPSLVYDELPGSNISEDSGEYWADASGVLYNKEKTLLIRAPQSLQGNYILPDTVKEISNNAFRDCASLTTVILPDGVTQIGENAFSGCDGLQVFCYRGDEAAWEQVSVGEGNEILSQVTVYYGSIPGDMDENSVINDADALYLLRYTLFPQRFPIRQSADVNGDGNANDADALYLLRYTLFPARFPLYPQG